MGFFEVFAAALAFFYSLIPSFGLAVILLTVAVRLVLLPLSIKQTSSMREMQKVQPEVKRIQQKHKGNRQKMNEEMMALYKEHGVNPFGGCLPMLLQFPVLIGLFYVIRSPLNYLGDQTALAGDLMGKAAVTVYNFLGIRLDCAASTALSGRGSDALREVSCGSGVVSALPYLVLILLMGYTTYYQQKQMQASRGPGTDPQMQQMQTFAKIMPVMFMIFGFTFPSGLVVYWLTTNVWTIGQQRIMLGAAASPGALSGNGKASKKADGKPVAGKPPKKATAKPPGGDGKPKPAPAGKKKKR